MPCSVGVDIVEIDRIKKAIKNHGNRFLAKVFSDEEITLCSKRIDGASCLAARFAAKEAFRKAVGLSIPSSWRDISVVIESNGRPVLKLPGGMDRALPGKFSVSLSHSRTHAVAVVLWEQS